MSGPSDPRGGRRPGAGRPREFEPSRLSLSLSPDQRRKLEELRERMGLPSVAAVLRALVEAA